MVGERGLIVRTLDGEQWSRLTQPTDANSARSMRGPSGRSSAEVAEAKHRSYPELINQ